MGAQIVLIEDEKEIRRLLSLSLEAQGYRTHHAATAGEGETMVATKRPDLVILDLGLPDMDGQQLITRLREWSSIPIIVLSARDQEQEKIDALEAGADDYLTKPFSPGELIARIKVALRNRARTANAEETRFLQGDLEIDFAARVVRRSGHELHLTPIEYKLLAILVRHAGKVITHTQLIREIWGKRAPESNQGLRIHMQHLREKLGDDPLEPTFILTEPGIGYRWKI